MNISATMMMALMFILQLSWSVWWPVFVIYGGLCMLTCNRRNSQESILP
jgi:ABC-type antimicrobial peptide transport system permease subunit